MSDGPGRAHRDTILAAIEIQDKLVAENPRAIEYRDRLAGSYHDLGLLKNRSDKPSEAIASYEKALPLYQRALNIREKFLGPEHPDTATSLNNLASLYASMSEYAKAEPLYRRAQAQLDQRRGEWRP